MSLYPVVILWEEPSGHLRFTTTTRRPWPGESEGQFLDRTALDPLTMHPELDPAWRRPNLALNRFPKYRRWFRPDGVAEETALAGAPEVQARNFLRIAGGFVMVNVPLLRGEFLRCVRRERNRRLALADSERGRLEDLGSPQQRVAHAQYRQQLRDLPATVQAQIAGLNTPEELEAYNPPWPVAPS